MKPLLGRRPAVPGIGFDLIARIPQRVAACLTPFRRGVGRVQPRRLPDVVGQRLVRLDLVDTRQLPDAIGVARVELRSLAPFEFRIASRQIQRRPPHLAVEQQIRLRHLDAAQVIELVRLPEPVKRPGRRAPRDDGLGIANLLADPFASTLKFTVGEVGLVVRL